MRSAGVSLPAGFEDMVVAAVDENFDSAFQFLQPRLVEFLAHFQSTIADAARHGHVRALDHDLVPEAWLVALERMHWRVCDVTDSLILPDCIAVVVDSENRDFMPFLLSGGQSYSKVLMPISSNRMLVGSSAEDFLCEGFNEMAAKCSYSFFVSAVNDNYISVLAPSIGDVSRRFVSSAVADAVSDRFRNME